MRRWLCALALMAAASTGCEPKVQVKHDVDVKPIEIKPIYITVDINIRIQKELDKFFDFEKPRATVTEKEDAATNIRGTVQ